jgi:uncharacterized membrane protein YfcA
MTRKATLFLQSVIVSAAGVALSLVLYSAWFKACCIDRLRDPIGFLIFPAIFVAMIIGGGIHSATPVDFTIGLVAELLGLWGIYLLMRSLWSKRKRKVTNAKIGPEG